MFFVAFLSLLLGMGIGPDSGKIFGTVTLALRICSQNCIRMAVEKNASVLGVRSNG